MRLSNWLIGLIMSGMLISLAAMGIRDMQKYYSVNESTGTGNIEELNALEETASLGRELSESVGGEGTGSANPLDAIFGGAFKALMIIPKSISTAANITQTATTALGLPPWIFSGLVAIIMIAVIAGILSWIGKANA